MTHLTEIKNIFLLSISSSSLQGWIHHTFVVSERGKRYIGYLIRDGHPGHTFVESFQIPKVPNLHHGLCVSTHYKANISILENRKTEYRSKIDEIFSHLWSRFRTKQQGGNGAEIADCWFSFFEHTLHTVYILFQTSMVYFRYNT